MSDSPHPVVSGRWIILALFAALCAWLVPGAQALQHDDDVLAFLPPEHPDVQTFQAVAERFGMLEVALVGVLPESESDDLLSPEPIAKLRGLHTKLTEVDGVRLVLSLPGFPNARVADDVLVVDELVPATVTDPAVMRARALSNPDAVGNVVSADGKAAAFIIFLHADTSAERFAKRARVLADIRQEVGAAWAGPTFFGGAPFVEHAASDSSRADIEDLSPIVIGVLVVVSALLLGSTTAAVLNLLVTGLGVLLIVGAHGRFGEPFTIVSSTTPVMMVALGGAFGMHVLAGYQRVAGTPAQRASATLRELWLPVVLSGVTTATAFFALRAMPQVPMQRFGMIAGLGVLSLLVLSLLVLPALLAVLPAKLLPTRPNRVLPWPSAPPTWALAVVAVVGMAGAASMAAGPDTAEVFDADSEPRRANAFFEDNFGGSQFLQLAVDVDLKHPVALREIREVSEAIATVDGVAEVRSLIGPVGLVTEGFGGRRGVPSTEGRARTVVANLADHPAAAQLMLPTADGAVVHIKLAPADSAAMAATTDAVRAIVAEHPDRDLRIGDATHPDIDAARREHVRRRVVQLSGTEVAPEAFDALVSSGGDASGARQVVIESRDRALGSDELIKPLSKEIYERLDPDALLTKRGPALKTYLETELPELVAADPEGLDIVVEFMATWIDDALAKTKLQSTCKTLGLPPVPVAETADGEDGALPGQDAPKATDEGAAPPQEDPGVAKCRAVIVALQELTDKEWAVPSGVDAPSQRSLPYASRLTGQPLIGQAFAESVTESLRISTLQSLGALAIVLLIARQLRALVPAVWTLAVTAGVIWALGHPISIGTSMVSCIALGAGVDFAIHLGIRARALGSGEAATAELGGVVGMAGLQLALAFCVLLASSMPPLRQFGSGLAIALLLAATGSVWLTPRLYRSR